jgi:RND family efflux transporter MFP subunit
VSVPNSPWMQSPRGMLAAGGLLLALLVAVPGYLSTARPPDGVSAQEMSGEATATTGDPLAPIDEDWLASEAAGVERPADTLRDSDGALDCLVQPSQMVEIGSQTIGLIEAVHVEGGSRVEAGQVVVELEAGVERAAVEAARMRAGMKGELRAREEQLVLSTSRRKRGSELFAKKTLSVDNRDELDTQARIAELELLQAKEARQLAGLELRQTEALLARRTLRAPFSGVVTEQLLQAGEIVNEETILKIAKVDPLRVDVLMPASRYGSVHPGMRISVQPEFPVEASVIATVSIVDPVIDAASGTFSVRMDLPNPEGKIPGGLHCTVKLLDE